jgi:hypothetical protein
VTLHAFYADLIAIAELPPDERRRRLAALHAEVAARYRAAVEAIADDGAARVTPAGRTVAQVVGHIAEWERYIIQSTGEVISGVRWPRLVTHRGYVEPDGSVHDFPTDDAFNAYQARKHAAEPWPAIKALALATSTTLHRLFADPELLPAERLEQTSRWDHYRLPTGVTLRVPCGWFLWMIAIEHEAAEHAEDLALGRAASAVRA